MIEGEQSVKKYLPPCGHGEVLPPPIQRCKGRGREREKQATQVSALQ